MLCMPCAVKIAETQVSSTTTAGESTRSRQMDSSQQTNLREIQIAQLGQSQKCPQEAGVEGVIDGAARRDSSIP